MLYLWTFTGTHSGTGRALRITGWEEWELGEDLLRHRLARVVRP